MELERSYPSLEALIREEISRYYNHKEPAGTEVGVEIREMLSQW